MKGGVVLAVALLVVDDYGPAEQQQLKDVLK